MEKRNRNIVFSLILSLVLLLITLQHVSSQEFQRADKLIKGITQLRPDDVTTIVASRGTFTGNVKGNFAVTGFETPQDMISWTVNAPKEDDYAISIIYSLKEQQNIEVRCGESALLAPSITQTWENRPFMWRQEIPGTLHLKEGENKITLRLPNVKPIIASEDEPDRFGFKVTKALHLWSIEFGTPKARKDQLARAMEIRGDASWMIEGKYGLFVHWSALSHPYYGEKPRADWFQESVEMFDVQVFADAVERTGASWITFTATHKGFYWPAPNAALDKIIPGRTSERDLLGEIIDELDKRGIKTIFYMHTAYNGYEVDFREAAGADDVDKKRYSDNIAAILRECSLRYGKKLYGFGYIDGLLMHDYPLDPSWEDWARAIKAGNPNAVVGFSSNRGPTVSPFNELSVTDGGADLRYPDPKVVGPGKQLGDVTTAWWCLMDGWFTGRPMNGSFGRGPKHSTQEYVDFFKEMAEKKVPVTINMLMTADVTAEHPIFNPKCMAVMEEIRKAIRGK